MSQEQFFSQQNLKDKYISKVDNNGYLRLGEVSRVDFINKQVKNIASLLDGSEGVNLGDGLRYLGDSGNYTDMKIHIDDLEAFVSKIKDYYKV